MFRSMTIIREHVLYRAEVILKRSVILRRYTGCGDVTACHRSARVLCAVQNVYFNVKGKVIPLQARCGPEGW